MNLIKQNDMAAFQEAVLKIIAPAKAHQRTGNNDGEQSFSYIVSELRYAGWRLGGHDCDKIDSFIAAGFNVRTVKCGTQYRTYIGL